MRQNGLVPLDDTVYALGYGRVSREEQALGLSLDAQRADRLRYIQSRGMLPYRDYEDVMSGRRDDRPDYQALLEEARRLEAEGRQVAIVVSDLDRLGRKLKEQIRCRDEMRDLGVKTHFVRQGGEITDFNANVLGSVAEEESRRTGERVKNVRRHVRQGGWHTPGRCAWGYLWRDATPEELRLGAPHRVYDLDPKRAPLAREALEAVANGTLTPRGAIVWMGGLSEEQRGGRAFSFRAARLLLSAAVYISRHEQPEDVPVLERPRCTWPAIISDETYAAIQARLEARSKLPSRDGVRYLLTGFLRCQRCDARMTGWFQESGGRYYRRYLCRGGQANGHARDRACSMQAAAGPLDAQVLGAVRDLLARLDDRRFGARLEEAWARLGATEDEDTAGRQRIARGLRIQISQAKKLVDQAVDHFLAGRLEESDYRRARERHTATIEAAERELTALGATPERRRPALPPLTQVLRDLGGWQQALARGTVDDQRAVLAELVEQVTPIRTGYGQYQARITWSPLALSLNAVRQVVVRNESLFSPPR